MTLDVVSAAAAAAGHIHKYGIFFLFKLASVL